MRRNQAMATTTGTRPAAAEIYRYSSVDARRREAFQQFLLLISLLALLALTLVPILLMLFFSLKDNGQIYGRFWDFPSPVRWENYSSGLSIMSSYIANTLTYSSISVVGVV